MLFLSTIINTYTIRMYNVMNAEKDVKLPALFTTQVHIHFYKLEHTGSMSELSWISSMTVLKKLYYTVLSIGNCQVYCFQSILFKVADIFVDKCGTETSFQHISWSENVFFLKQRYISFVNKCSMFHIFFEIKLYKCSRFTENRCNFICTLKRI